jgi:predicted DNA-binding transcriptional regulator AlpA
MAERIVTETRTKKTPGSDRARAAAVGKVGGEPKRSFDLDRVANEIGTSDRFQSGPSGARAGPWSKWPDLDRVLTEAEAARIMGCSQDTLRREFRAGNSPPRIRISGRRIGYRLSAIYAWLDARIEKPGAEGELA